MADTRTSQDSNLGSLHDGVTIDALAPHEPRRYEIKLRVERRLLEHILQAPKFVVNGEHLFDRLARQHKIRAIAVDPNFKIGARSKKDPTVRVQGEEHQKLEVDAAAAELADYFDSRTNRVVMRVDIPAEKHYFVIGKKGCNVREAMNSSGCHIHFPETSRDTSSATPSKNQVTITGLPEGVEQARIQLRALTPVIICLEIPPFVPRDELRMTPLIQNTAERYAITVFFKQHSGRVFVMFKGPRGRASVLEEAARHVLSTWHVDPSLRSYTLQFDISSVHHAALIGHAHHGAVAQLMQRTNTKIVFLDPGHGSSLQVTGRREDVKLVLCQMQTRLPISITFDIPPDGTKALMEFAEQNHQSSLETALAAIVDQFPTIRCAFKLTGQLLTITLRGIEAAVSQLYQARRALLIRARVRQVQNFGYGDIDIDAEDFNTILYDPKFAPPFKVDTFSDIFEHRESPALPEYDAPDPSFHVLPHHQHHHRHMHHHHPAPPPQLPPHQHHPHQHHHQHHPQPFHGHPHQPPPPQPHQHQHQHQHQQPPPPASLPGAVAANTAATSSSSSLSSSSGSRHSGRLTPLPTTATLTPFVPTFTQAYAMQIHQANNTRVLVMINGHCDSAKTMARAIYRTWTTVPGREFVTVRFVVGDSGTREQACSGEPEVEENMMVYLRQCSDDYPPVDKVLCMWEHARTTWLDAYDYFLKVDADTYLNIPNLLVLLAMNPPTRPLFAGGVGSGRDGDLPAYCMGPAYILSRHTLGAVPSDVQAKATKLPNSDTTFSYFVTEHSGVTCMDHVHKQFRWSFMNRYWDFRDGAITGVTLNEQAQSVLPLYHPLNSALFNTVSAHPLKTERDMVVFHEAVFYNRLPLFPNPKATQQRPTPPQLRNLCVYNPARQYEISGFVLRECPPRRPHRPRKLQEAFVLHLAHDQGSVARAMAMAKELRAHSIKASLFNGVDGAHLDTATHQAFTSSSYLASSSASSSAHADKGKGASSNSTSSSSSSSPSSAVHALSARDVGRRETYRLLLHRVFSATDDNDALYLVVEDDVVLSPVFAQRLDTLLQDPRCGSYLSSGSGGALLLGATIARNGTYPRVDAHTGGWAMADEEMRRTPGTMCYNFNSGVENTFAFVLERRAMQLLLTWLSNPSHANQPFDHAWRYLCDRGMPVRVAFPYIVIPHRDAGREHSPVDTSTWEHVHRWTFQNDDKRRRR